LYRHSELFLLVNEDFNFAVDIVKDIGGALPGNQDFEAWPRMGLLGDEELSSAGSTM
jgi:hypothetical protein